MRDIINIMEWLLFEFWFSYSDDDLVCIRFCFRIFGVKICYVSRDGEFYEWVFMFVWFKVILCWFFSVFFWYSIGIVILYILEYIFKVGILFYVVLKDKKRG